MAIDKHCRYTLKQRWLSKSEPELGLGFVDSITDKQIVIQFKTVDCQRCYEIQDAPLVRVRLSVGSMAENCNGLKFIISKIKEQDGLIEYISAGGESINEQDLSDTIDLSTPQNRIKTKQVDANKFFDLRLHALKVKSDLLQSPLRGLQGGCVKLYPHQMYIAENLCKRHEVRVLLADEVGLGKTIEAALTIHRLILTSRIKRVMIIVPDSLVNQWFVEFYCKFNLSFTIIDEDWIEDNEEDLKEALESSQFFICPLGLSNEVPVSDVNWDVICADEVHNIEPKSEAFDLLKTLCSSSPHVILLSATPEQKGRDAHFQRLCLLDSARFHSWEEYCSEQKTYHEIADLAKKLLSHDGLLKKELDQLTVTLKGSKKGDVKEKTTTNEGRKELLNELLDLHGLGRLIFRNVRDTIGGFPKRIFNPTPLSDKKIGKYNDEFKQLLGIEVPEKFSGILSKEDVRIQWLIDFIQNISDQKVLVICKDKNHTIQVFKELEKKTHRKYARFTEDMSLLERDRQAAWFSEENGPLVLFSSPLGAEGRNFQCAQNLVLMDIPFAFDALEQRIGRLDRIGQGSEFFIYTPHVKGSAQEILIRWYDEVLGAFNKPWKGSDQMVHNLKEELGKIIFNQADDSHAVFFEKAKKQVDELAEELEKGRDVLLEINSFNSEEAFEIVSDMQKKDDDEKLDNFMLNAFERHGIEAEDDSNRTYILKAGDGYSQPIPGFKEEGMTVTFSRERALKRDDMTFLTWDHPMVLNSLDSLTTSDLGNASVVLLKASQENIIIDLLFVVNHVLPESLRAERFFPPQPIRIAYDKNLKDVTGLLPQIDSKVQNAKAEVVLSKTDALEYIDPIVKMARGDVDFFVNEITEVARAKMHTELDPVLKRLLKLKKVNAAIKQSELDLLDKEIENLDSGLQQVKIRLDAIRVIACYRPLK